MSDTAPTGRRERKKATTRQTIVDAILDSGWARYAQPHSIARKTT